MSVKSSLLAGLACCALTGSGTALAAGPRCPDGPILLGAIATATGPADFSEVPKAAKAYFDEINAAGGINGCKIDYAIADDKADPQVAAQAARDLIDNKKIVAMVGGSSLLECAVNAPTYKRSNILSVPGVGVDPVCYHSTNIAPVSSGPYTATTGVGLFATNVLKSKNLCAMFSIVGGTQEAYKEGLARWETLSGQKARLVDTTLPQSGDMTPYILKARDAGCDAVVLNVIEPAAVAWVKSAEAQRVKGIDWLFLAPAYTAQVAQALAGTTQSVYVQTEWEPFTDLAAPGNKEWVASMEKAGRPLTAFSQGGYLSAKVLVDAIKAIDGPATRESVAKALQTMKPVRNPPAGDDYAFRVSTDRPHAIKVVKLVGGKWVPASPDWIIIPPKS
jgi:branched-chain amino acid transport system substrate-binding protein